jgi:hypothetical protein
LSNAANRLGILPHRQQANDDRFRGALGHVTHPLFRESLATGCAEYCELVDKMVAASA